MQRQVLSRGFGRGDARAAAVGRDQAARRTRGCRTVARLPPETRRLGGLRPQRSGRARPRRAIPQRPYGARSARVSGTQLAARVSLERRSAPTHLVSEPEGLRTAAERHVQRSALAPPHRAQRRHDPDSTFRAAADGRVAHQIECARRGRLQTDVQGVPRLEADPHRGRGRPSARSAVLAAAER